MKKNENKKTTAGNMRDVDRGSMAKMGIKFIIHPKDQKRKEEMELRVQCVELAIRSQNYGHSAIATLASKIKPTSVTADAKRILNFIKTGR